MLLNENTKKIALIDDDAAVRDSTQWLLQSLGFQTVTFASAEEFLDSGDLQEICCVISDVRMPGMSGLELQRVLCDPFPPMIFMTAFVDDHIELHPRGRAFGCLAKPVAEGADLVHPLGYWITGIELSTTIPDEFCKPARTHRRWSISFETRRFQRVSAATSAPCSRFIGLNSGMRAAMRAVCRPRSF
jgi:CheY-like chemotaxis protein